MRLIWELEVIVLNNAVPANADIGTNNIGRCDHPDSIIQGLLDMIKDAVRICTTLSLCALATL